MIVAVDFITIGDVIMWFQSLKGFGNDRRHL